MTNIFPRTAQKGRKYVSPGRSFALRSAGQGRNPLWTKSTVAPNRLKSTLALGATLLEKLKMYLLAIAQSHRLLVLQADNQQLFQPRTTKLKS